MDYTAHGILQARLLEWVAFPLSRGSFQPRDQTQVSHIASRFFTSWVTKEAQPKAKTYFLHSFFCYSFFHVPNILCYYFFKVVSIIKGYPVFIPVNNFYYIALR